MELKIVRYALSDKSLLHEKMLNAGINAVAGLVMVVLGVVLLHWVSEQAGLKLPVEILVVMGIVGVILIVVGLLTAFSYFTKMSLHMSQLEK
jgi:hypothetical protein